MNKTQNYQLNQWEASDRVQRTDFNADNAKIDAAIAAVDAKADALSAGKATKTALEAVEASIPRLVTGTHVGTGTKDPLHISLGFRPKLVFVRAGSVRNTSQHCLGRLMMENLTVEFATNSYVYVRPGGKGGTIDDDGFTLQIGNNCDFNISNVTDYYWAIR